MGVSKYWGLYMLEMLWCAQKPWYTYFKDEWCDDEVDSMMEVGGNSSANSIYEAFIPEGFSKPGPDSGHDEHTKFIRAKYELQEFVKPSLRLTSGKSVSLQSSFSRKIIDSFCSHSTQSKSSSEGMVEHKSSNQRYDDE